MGTEGDGAAHPALPDHAPGPATSETILRPPHGHQDEAGQKGGLAEAPSGQLLCFGDGCYPSELREVRDKFC